MAMTTMRARTGINMLCPFSLWTLVRNPLALIIHPLEGGVTEAACRRSRAAGWQRHSYNRGRANIARGSATGTAEAAVPVGDGIFPQRGRPVARQSLLRGPGRADGDRIRVLDD